METTEYAATMTRLTPRHIHRIIGIWTWHFTIFRELLSLFSAVYRCVAEYDYAPDTPRPAWRSVTQELKALCALAPLASCPLNLPWSQRVLMTEKVTPGEQHTIALLAANGPMAAPGGAVFVRYANLAFEWREPGY